MQFLIKNLRHKMLQKSIKSILIKTSYFHIISGVSLFYDFTGFTGSYGVLLITDSELKFYTDSRYLSQAKTELNEDYSIYNISQFHPRDIKGIEIHYDPKSYFISEINEYKSKMIPLSQSDLELFFGSWITEHNYKIIDYNCGATSLEKCKSAAMDKPFFVACPISVAWLINVRNIENSYIPIIPECYAILHPSAFLECFTDLDFDLNDFTDLNHVRFHSIDDLSEHLSSNEDITFDPDITSCCFKKYINQDNETKSSIEYLKSIKSPDEIEGFINAHLEDGAALTKFMHWLYYNEFTEYSAHQQLLSYRKESKLFYQESFHAISAFGPNASIVHYTKNTKEKIEGNNFYLIDSGGHYFGGTTDVTRTIPIGQITNEQKRNYTLVLKGHINLATALFPEGTSGNSLDVLARIYLWRSGLNYDHSTGHGVGNCLSVHEGPHSMSSSLPLKEGMIISNEPGFYKDDFYGIRIENLMYVVNNGDGFLSFKPLTMVPINCDAILLDMLDDREKSWLSDYNLLVYNCLSKKLSPDVCSWYSDNILCI